MWKNITNITPTVNIIAESIHTQYDRNRKKYLLLDLLVDYHKDVQAMNLTDQQISAYGRPVTHKTAAG